MCDGKNCHANTIAVHQLEFRFSDRCAIVSVHMTNRGNARRLIELHFNQGVRPFVSRCKLGLHLAIEEICHAEVPAWNAGG
jgi:hypothetical protein